MKAALGVISLPAIRKGRARRTLGGISTSLAPVVPALQHTDLWLPLSHMVVCKSKGCWEM